MGSKPRPPVWLIGERFGKLVVTSLRHVRRENGLCHYMALCRCDCGNTKEVLTSSLRAARIRTCGCGRDQYYKIRGKNSIVFTGYEEISGKSWRRLRMNAKERGIVFDITIEYAWGLFVAQARRCALSGVPISFWPSLSASLDRIDSNGGYEQGNVQWLHKRINIMKGTLSNNDFRAWCGLVSGDASSEEPVDMDAAIFPARTGRLICKQSEGVLSAQ